MSSNDLINYKIIIRKVFHGLDIIRYWNWQERIQSIMMATMLVLMNEYRVFVPWAQLIVFIAYLYCIYAYGYLLNVYADREADLKVQKTTFTRESKSMIRNWLIVLGMITLLTPVYFQNVYILLLTFFGVTAATLYSMRPIRLKEKGLIGLLIAAICQRLPFLFIMYIIPAVNFKLIIYLFGWLLIISFLIEISHQLSDHSNDLKTKTNTFVVMVGVEKTKAIIFYNSLILGVYLFLPVLENGFNGLFMTCLLFIFSHGAIAYTNAMVGSVKSQENIS